MENSIYLIIISAILAAIALNPIRELALKSFMITLILLLLSEEIMGRLDISLGYFYLPTHFLKLTLIMDALLILFGLLKIIEKLPEGFWQKQQLNALLNCKTFSFLPNLLLSKSKRKEKAEILMTITSKWDKKIYEA